MCGHSLGDRKNLLSFTAILFLLLFLILFMAILCAGRIFCLLSVCFLPGHMLLISSGLSLLRFMSLSPFLFDELLFR